MDGGGGGTGKEKRGAGVFGVYLVDIGSWSLPLLRFQCLTAQWIHDWNCYCATCQNCHMFNMLVEQQTCAALFLR